MRDMDSRDVLEGDFIVVYGDAVSNLSLEPALAAHRARRMKDKNAIMTMVLREAGSSHRTKPRNTKPVFVIDPTQDRCLQFEQIPNRDGTSHLTLDPSLIFHHEEIDLREDLIDCGIDICTPDVLALWSDNFDFQAPRRGFLHSVLKDYELNGKTIHTFIATEQYAARVRNLHAYNSISKDIVSRWAYPLSPDTNLLPHQTYRRLKGNIYMEDGVILARSCKINQRTVIGQRTSVGDGTVITGSVIGRHCSIGRNVTIDGAYIWDHVYIADGVVVKQAMIADECSIGRKCRVNSGALLSYGVRISDGVEVPYGSRITRAKREQAMGGNFERSPSDPAVVGEHGDGFEYHDEEEEEEEEGPVDSLVSFSPGEFSRWYITHQ
jgi:translation initiation factor eIF-2B subunit epsilon